jgi:hypothetical protein
METGYHFGMFGTHHSIMSQRKRSEASMGKMTSFCACTSLSMSAWIVPRRFAHAAGAEAALRGGDEHGEDDRRGGVHRHRDGGVLARQVEAGEEPRHVLDGVDGHAALADLAEHALVVGIEAVERGAVERGGKAQALLV